MGRWVIAAIDRYGRIKSKFNTYESEDLANADLDHAVKLYSMVDRAWRAVAMTEYSYDRKIENQATRD